MQCLKKSGLFRFSLTELLLSMTDDFPEHTDHTALHSMTVIDFCIRLMCPQVGRLNADELYALLTGCYFHDAGIGLSRRDFEGFSSD